MLRITVEAASIEEAAERLQLECDNEDLLEMIRSSEAGETIFAPFGCVEVGD